jgi:chorismate mutase/prephenate dehydratase
MPPVPEPGSEPASCGVSQSGSSTTPVSDPGLIPGSADRGGGPSETAALGELRRRIDDLDAELVRLISARGELAAAIGRLKQAAGAPIYAPDREHEVLQRLEQLNRGPFPQRVLSAIYRELMSGSFLLERPLRIAYLGPRGSFSHLAATGKFGASVEYEPVADIAGVFAEVERERVDFGVVPVENSTGGGVVDTLDALAGSRARICAEILRQIHHHLLARVPLERVVRVYSKPEVFSQCQQWLLETGLLHKTVPAPSSSRAAELAAAEEGAAAIGSALAAELYGLPIQREHIEDNPQNTTRFFVLGREPARPTGDDKTTVMFATQHRAGALVDVLTIFRREGVNLTMITSRPSKRQNWEYYFFVDADGHARDPALARALEAARELCSVLTVLGSFPRAAAAF